MGWVQSIKALFASSATPSASQDFQGPGGSVESLIQSIGAECMALAEGDTGRILFHAEIEVGCTGPALFCLVAPGKLRYVIPSAELTRDAYALWEGWMASGNAEWRVMNYLIVDGKFSIDYVYPEQIDESENLVARRKRTLMQYFGEVQVEYPKP